MYSVDNWMRLANLSNNWNKATDGYGWSFLIGITVLLLIAIAFIWMGIANG